jgi:hypothetical protein
MARKGKVNKMLKRQILVLLVGVLALTMMAKGVSALCFGTVDYKQCEQISPTCTNQWFCKDTALCGQYTSQANYYKNLAQKCYATSNYMQVVYEGQWKANTNLANRYCSSCHKEQVCQNKIVSVNVFWPATAKCPTGYKETFWSNLINSLSSVSSAKSVGEFLINPGKYYTIEQMFKALS